MIKIKNILKREISEDYRQKRDSFWDSKIVEYKEKNIPLWNGTVYCLEDTKSDEYIISLCEYKDILFSEYYGYKKVLEEFGPTNVFKYINVQILIKNSRDEFIFGTIKKDDYTEIVSVGGTLRIENNKEIKRISDINEYAVTEVSIETNFDNYDDIKFIGVSDTDEICTFLYSMDVEFLPESNLKIGEFEAEVILSLEYAFKSAIYKPCVRLNSIKGYLDSYGFTENN